MPIETSNAKISIDGSDPHVPGATGNRPSPKHDVSNLFIVKEANMKSLYSNVACSGMDVHYKFSNVKRQAVPKVLRASSFLTLFPLLSDGAAI